MFRHVPGCSMFQVLSTAVTADIYYYMTTEFGHAKHELRPAAHCGSFLESDNSLKSLRIGMKSEKTIKNDNKALR